MKKAPLGLILFLYISLFSGSTQSLPQRSARMDSEWKEEKRGNIVDDAIIVEPEDEEPSLGSENGRPSKILPFNRMAIRKRNIVSVDENGQTFPGTAETGGDHADLFRPLNEKRQIVPRPDYVGLTYPGNIPEGLTTIKLNPGHAVSMPLPQKRQIVSVDNDGQASQGTAETGVDNAALFRPLNEKRRIRGPPVHPPYGKREVVSVDNDGQTSQGPPETGVDNAELFRPLVKRQIVSVDNDGQTSEGTAETGVDNANLFRPLPPIEKREIVSVDNDGQIYEGTPDTGNSPLFRPLPPKEKRPIVSGDPALYEDNSHLFRPLPPKEKRYNSMMELTRLPAHKKRSGN